MPRALTQKAPAFVPKLNKERLELSIKVATPMMGGSAKSGQPNTWVRSASVASALRNWWRMAYTRTYATLTELKTAEAARWGWASQPGSISVSVTTTKPGELITVYREDASAFGYPTYGFIDSPAQLAKDIEFQLRIDFPNAYKTEVVRTLTSFLFYGGVGARTRRGFGSLHLINTVNDLPMNALPKTSLNRAILPGCLSRQSFLPESVFYGEEMQDPKSAWKNAVSVYQAFRQDIDLARDTDGEDHPVAGFPKADLGLPIVFTITGAGEPSTLTLQGATHRHYRFASPIITKVLFFKDKTVPMIALLNAPHVWDGYGVRLGETVIPADQLNLDVAARSQVPPLNGHPIRTALATFIEEKKRYTRL